jgi:indole-3-glycerol phosphate synthase
MAPDGCILVSESGIFTRDEIMMLHNAGVDAILVGESLMREADPALKVIDLLGTG